MSTEGCLSYQVIARKWRPKGFNELVGQSHISQTLLNALKNGRLPHALLFTGPRGTGKTSSARILAKSLRCPNAEDFTPCNTCEECEDISSGKSVNVIEIDGASNNGVDAIRELRDTVSYMPSSGFHKVYIIDEVHMLSTSAFNALLKTLEEPPEHVVFIMATTEVHKIPNTILSRCQRFDFRRISLKLICERLRTICKSDGVKVDDDALWMVARQGDGSMRDSQSLLDQVITFSDNHITLQKVVNVLGLTDRSLLTTTVEALINRDTQAVLNVIEQIFTAGFDPKVYSQDLLEELRNLLIIKLCPSQEAQVIDLPDAEIEHLRTLSKDLSQEDIHMLFDMALKGGNEIPRAQDPRIVLEMLLLRMASAPRIKDLSAFLSGNTQTQTNTSTTPVKKKVITAQPKQAKASHPTPPRPTPPRQEAKPVQQAKPPQKNSTASQPEARPQSSPPEKAKEALKAHTEKEAPKPSIPLSDNQAKWMDLVTRVKKINQLIGAKLDHTFLIDINGNDVKVGVPDKMKFLYDQVTDKGFLKKLTTYMNTFWGGNHVISVTTSGSGVREQKKSPQLTPKQIAQKTKEAQTQKEREEVMSHPLFKKVNEHFKTEIQSIKELK